MITTCPNCKKKFKIDHALIPKDGRDLKCGSCNHIWFYKVEVINSKTLSLIENINDNEIETDIVQIESDDKLKKNQIISKEIIKEEEKKINTKKFKEKEKPLSVVKKKNVGGKFFSYLIVFIISFVALIILLETLKEPLINVFPGLEIILFSLFETLQDIKLFIKDLY